MTIAMEVVCKLLLIVVKYNNYWIVFFFIVRQQQVVNYDGDALYAHGKSVRREYYVIYGGRRTSRSVGSAESADGRRRRRRSWLTVGRSADESRADYVTRGRDEADHGRTGSAAQVLYTLRPAVARLLETR